MEQSQLLAHCGGSKLTREELQVVSTPPGSPTHPLALLAAVLTSCRL
jgi:hypothetical protein